MARATAKSIFGGMRYLKTPPAHLIVGPLLGSVPILPGQHNGVLVRRPHPGDLKIDRHGSAG